jgi:hypothetical protein
MLGLFFTSLIFLFSPSVFATLTYSQSSGSSAVDLTNPAAPILYGSFAGACSSNDVSCNSCTGEIIAGTTTGLFPCSPNNVNSTTNLSIVFTSSVPILTAPEAHITNATGLSVGTVSWTSGTSSFTLNANWADICGKAPVNSDSACKKDIDLDLYVAVTSSTGGTTGGTGTEVSTTVKIATRYADITAAGVASWSYVDCPADDLNTAKVGFCHFLANAGDEKIYAGDLAVSSSFPATDNSAVLYKNLIFFYELQTDADKATADPDAATLARITNGSDRFELGVDVSATPPVADSRIDGLVNGSRYCLKMATQDVTGLINYFTPSSVAASALCATPEPVVGLLDDKHCFIATAAFGSDMAPEVQSLREFRNQFLLPFPWGRQAVKFYYKYSPKFASMISRNENIRAIVRGTLWPILYFAKTSIHHGFLQTLATLFFMIFGVSIVFLLVNSLFRQFLKPRKKREAISEA